MVSFIILEYHSLDEVHKCVQSLISHIQHLEFEIIISSNSTYDTEKQNIIKRGFPGCTWVFNRKNHGFAGGMNAGIRKISESSEFIIVLNQDVTIKSGSLERIFDLFKHKNSIGLAGVKIIDIHGNVQDSFRKFYTPISIIYRQLKRIYKKKVVQIEYSEIKNGMEVDWVIGAFMVIPRTIIEEVGMFDENYFLYVEDMDLCYRVRKKGYKIAYFTEFVIEYAGDRKSLKLTGSKWKPNKYLLFHIKSYLYFLKKHKLFLKFSIK